MITILGPVIVFLALYVGLVCCLGRTRRGVNLWVTAATIITTLRLGVLWALLALHWADRLSLAALPLLLVLLPEGLLLPRNYVWTVARAILATSVLVAGSMLWTALTVLLVGLVWKPSARPETRESGMG